MIIIVRRPGQLGNSLFHYAHFIAFGIEKKIHIANPAFYEYASYFEGSHNSLISSYITSHSIVNFPLISKTLFYVSFYFGITIQKSGIKNKYCASISLNWHESLDLDNLENAHKWVSRYTFVQGWLFRANNLFSKYRNEIINYFTPVPAHLETINKFMLPLKTEYDIVIGVHIRRGDYKFFAGGKHFYSLEEYQEVMENVVGLFPGQKICFLICSNEQHVLADFKGLNCIFGPNHQLEDMYCLAKCNYIVGPPSTYTMWASYYGQVKLYMINDPGSPVSLSQFNIIYN